MEKCKYCQADLAENGTFCPNCGRDNAEPVSVEEVTPVEETAVQEETPAAEPAPVAEASAAEPVAEIKEGIKATPGKIAIAVAAVVVLLAVLIALLAGGFGNAGSPEDTTPDTTPATGATEETVPATIPADGNPDDETCKGTYTASDEEVIAIADTVVATAGDYELTNSQLQVYYWMEVQNFLNSYGAYAAYFGLDYTQPLDTQVCGIAEQGTWQQFFLTSALHSWQNYQSMAAEADAANYELDAEYQELLDNLEQNLEESAASGGFESGAALLADSVGNAAGMEDYAHFLDLYYRGYAYYADVVGGFTPTEAEIEAYYTENEAAYIESGLSKDDLFVDVRHILVFPEGGTTAEDGTVTYSDEEWAACEASAQAILDEWLAGEKTEESFAALANEKSADGGSNTNGGLYEDVVVGQMVPNFENWCFDTSRKVGDYGLVKTEYGYHVMYFVGSDPCWLYYVESDMITERSNNFVNETVAKYPLTVDYSAILLALSGLGA